MLLLTSQTLILPQIFTVLKSESETLRQYINELACTVHLHVKYNYLLFKEEITNTIIAATNRWITLQRIEVCEHYKS